MSDDGGSLLKFKGTPLDLLLFIDKHLYCLLETLVEPHPRPNLSLEKLQIFSFS